MCLSIPGRIVAISDDMADADVGGTLVRIGIQLLECVNPGDYVLIHSGFALQVISEKDAEEQLALIMLMKSGAS